MFTWIDPFHRELESLFKGDNSHNIWRKTVLCSKQRWTTLLMHLLSQLLAFFSLEKKKLYNFNNIKFHDKQKGKIFFLVKLLKDTTCIIWSQAFYWHRLTTGCWIVDQSLMTEVWPFPEKCTETLILHQI